MVAKILLMLLIFLAENTRCAPSPTASDKANKNIVMKSYHVRHPLYKLYPPNKKRDQTDQLPNCQVAKPTIMDYRDYRWQTPFHPPTSQPSPQSEDRQ